MQPKNPIDRKYLMPLLVGSLLFQGAVSWLESSRMPLFADDWNKYFQPAAQVFVHGGNPYTVHGFWNPIWTLFPLIPFALLGRTGAILWDLFSMSTFAYVAYRLRARPAALIAFLLSPVVAFVLFMGNIDALVLWGFILPAPIGLFFAVIKPQVGVTMAIYWAYTTWRDHGLRRTVMTFLPVSVALALNFLVYGNWLGSTQEIAALPWNASLFPWSVPLGLGLLGFALWRRKVAASAAASPLVSPYSSWCSWSVVLMGLLEYDFAMLLTVAALWAVIGYGIVVYVR